MSYELPVFAYRTPSESGRYFRLEVFTATGSHGYDVFDYDVDPLIADVIGHYESHLEYLRLSERGADASLSDDEPAITDWRSDFTGQGPASPPASADET